MSKIHFAALLGVDYEMDIFPYWAKYYSDMNFDSYKIFLHRQDAEIGEDIKKTVRQFGFNVESFGGHHGNGMLRKFTLGHYASTLPPDDLLVTADADEYQCSPGVLKMRSDPGNDDVFVGGLRPTPPNYRKLEEYYDIISGFMSDRYTGRLETCFQEPFIQYPFEEPFTRDIIKGFTPPYLRKSRWSETRRTKILAARAGMDIAFEGSHVMRTVPTSARLAEDFRVVHFAWRESARRKLAVKSYFSSENLNEIFGGNVPKEYADMIDRMSPEMLSNSFTL